jgi:CBS domain-containing protein
LKEFKVWDVCTKHDVSEGAPNRTLESAILIMGSKGFRRLPITKIGKIHGILTISDLLRAISEIGFPNTYKASISEYMTLNPKTIHLDESLYKASKIMTEGNFGSLIVVGDTPDKIQGIITERDILRASANMGFKSDMKVKDIGVELLKYDVLSSDENTPLMEVIKQMVVNHHHRIVVTSSNNVIGVVSAINILNLISKEKEEIKSNPNFLESLNLKFLITNDLITVTMDTPILEAIETMTASGLGGLPVVEDGKLMGMFTERSLVHYFGTPQKS